MSFRRIGTLALGALQAILAGCGPGPSNEVVVYTSVDQVFSEPVLWEFQQRTSIEVLMVFDTEETKSTGLLNRLIAESEHPQADVFWSGDPVRPQILVRRGLVEPYAPPTAQDISPEYRAADGSWVGFSARARVLLVNTDLVPESETPQRVDDLTDPRWRGRVAIANPAFGTTTMHMAALFAAWGDERGRAFLDGLRANEVRIASSNGEVKRLVSEGEVAWGLTDTDDAAVAVTSGAPVRVVYPDQSGLGTLLMPTVAVMMRGGPHPETARRLMDFLASRDVERMLAFAECAQMPLRDGVESPPHVSPASSHHTMAVDYAALGDVMDRIHPLFRDWAEGRPASASPEATH